MAALRSVAAPPPADTVDWWSLRRRIADDAIPYMTGATPSRVVAALVWWRRMVPVGIAATVLAAVIAAGSTTTASAATAATSDSTAAVWVRAATTGATLAERDVDPIGASTSDAWFAAAVEPSTR